MAYRHAGQYGPDGVGLMANDHRSRVPSGVRRPDEQAWPELQPEPAGSGEESPWAWAGRGQPDAARVDVSAARVSAVLVCLDAARWLPATLAGLAALEVTPQRLIAIDNGSTDATAPLLEQARAEGLLDAVYRGERGFGFGTAVKAALRQDRRALTGSTDTAVFRAALAEDDRWLWLLHDDAVPAPDALYRLLAHVNADQHIDITGPKLLLPRRRQSGHQLSEVGVTISGTGRRDLQIDLGEIDQGQRDQPGARLGVSTCGMLVKTAVWQDLDGLDPALPVFRDGVEFGWRAHLNGYRVVTTPSAQMTHRQVGRAGLRPRGLSGRHPGALDRVLGMRVVAGHAPAATLPLVWLRLVASCLLRALGYLLGKAPGRAADELRALGSFVRHPSRLRELRRRTAAIDPTPGTADVVRRLRPPWWASFRVAGEVFAGALSDRYGAAGGEVDAASLDELTTDEFSSVAAETPRYRWLRPGVVLLVLALVASLVAARGLLGLGALTAPTLLPAYDSLRGLWSAVWAPIPGAPGQISPPWLALTAVGSTLTLGQPEWFTTVLICGVVPLSWLAVYPVLRRLVVGARLRPWVAATYALLPVLLGATNQGRITLSVFAVALPLLVVAVRALVLRRVRTPEAWRGGWGAGVLLVLLSAFQPAVLGLAVLLGLIGAVALRRSPRKIGRIGLALGLPLIVLLPWWPSLILAPGRILVGPDAALGGVPPAPAVVDLLLGRGLGPGLPPWWIGGVVLGAIWVLAVLGLLRRPRSGVVLAAWTTALLSLAVAVGLSRLVVSVPPVGTQVRPWVGAFLLVAFAALLLAGGTGVDGWLAEMAGRSFGWVQPAAVLAGAAMAVVTLGGAAWWVWDGARGPIERDQLQALPPYVAVALTAQPRARVLAVELTPEATRYSVLSGGAVRQGDADRGFAFGGSTTARADLADVVTRLVSGAADTQVSPQLRALGVGYVFVRGADEQERTQIANTPGLGTASGNEQGVVWQLDPPGSRAAIVVGDSRVPLSGTDAAAVGRDPAADAVLEPGPGERVLLTGEAADPRWRAEFGGRVLTPTTEGWQQGFLLPAEGGPVSWKLPALAHWFLPLQGLVLLVAGVLAAPGIRRPEVRDPVKSARRAATLSEVA